MHGAAGLGGVGDEKTAGGTGVTYPIRRRRGPFLCPREGGTSCRRPFASPAAVSLWCRSGRGLRKQGRKGGGGGVGVAQGGIGGWEQDSDWGERRGFVSRFAPSSTEAPAAAPAARSAAVTRHLGGGTSTMIGSCFPFFPAAMSMKTEAGLVVGEPADRSTAQGGGAQDRASGTSHRGIDGGMGAQQGRQRSTACVSVFPAKTKPPWSREPPGA